MSLINRRSGSSGVTRVCRDRRIGRIAAALLLPLAVATIACGGSKSSAPDKAGTNRAAATDGTLATTFDIAGAANSSVAYAGGKYLVAYEKNGGIYGQIVSFGAPVGTEFQISDAKTPGVSPAAAFDQTSNYAVVWRGTGNQVYLRQVPTATVSQLTTSIQTVAGLAQGSLATTISAPAIASSASNQYVVTYQPDASSIAATAALFSGGTPNFNAAPVASGTTVQGVPAVVSNGSAYDLFYSDASAVRVAHMSTKTQNKAITLTVSTSGTQVSSAAKAPTGAPRAAWSTTTSTYAVVWNASGELVSRTCSVTVGSGKTQPPPITVTPGQYEYVVATGVSEPRVAANGTEGWVVVYAAGAGSEVRGRRLATTAEPNVEGAFWISKLASGESVSAVATDSSGAFIVTTSLASGPTHGRIGQVAPYPLTIALNTARHGSGKVSSVSSSWSDPVLDDDLATSTTYTHLLAAGTTLTLKASAASDHDRFDGFTGDYAADTGCVMNGAKHVDATFSALYDVTTGTSGAGTGTISTTATGSSCASGGSSCVVMAEGSAFTVTATPTNGSSVAFTIVPDGSCSVSGNVATCTVPTPSPTYAARTQSVTVAFGYVPPQMSAITIQTTGNGSVTSSPAGTSCGPACLALPSNTPVSLAATPGDYQQFDSWTDGPCKGSTSATCSFTASESSYAVAAAFSTMTSKVTVSKAGAGAGDVWSEAPAGISCTDINHCTSASFDFPIGAQNTVTLKASGANGSTFRGWSGECTGTGDCVLTLNTTAPHSVSATFDPPPPPPRNLTVLLSGTGVGSVTATPADLNGHTISCEGTCAGTFRQGDTVVLTATPQSGTSALTKWTGCTTSSGTSCTVTLDTSDVSVTAQFDLLSATVSVTASAYGTIASTPAGIDCGPSATQCSTSFPVGSINLTATPIAGYEFVQWTSGCSGTSPACTLALGAGGASVSAEFARTTYAVNVTASGTGTGSVTSSPAGIDCSAASCSARFNESTDVLLTANPTNGSTFAWSGACTGSSTTCALHMDQSKSVAIVFSPAAQPDPTPITYPVTVRVFGNGVVSGGGITSCTGSSGTCDTTVPANTAITLTAQTLNGSTFDSWGSCPGTVNGATCTFTPTASTVVSASFRDPVVTADSYMVIVREFGVGKVTGGGIDCSANGGACSAQVPAGGTITFAVDPTWSPQAMVFDSWSGCTSNPDRNTCSVKPGSNTVVIAVFKPAAPPPVVETPGLKVILREFGPVGSVKIGGATTSCIANEGACAADVASGGSITLTAQPTGTLALDHWSGCQPTSDPLVCTVSNVTQSTVVGAFYVDTTRPPPPPATFTIILRQFGLVGTVTSTGAVSGKDINCTGNVGACAATVDNGKTLTLTARPLFDQNATITWGGCSGQTDQHSATCTVPADKLRVVTVSFETGPTP